MTGPMQQALWRCLDVSPRARARELRKLVMDVGKPRLHALFEDSRRLADGLTTDEVARLVLLFTKLEDLEEPYRLGRGSATVVPNLLDELSRSDPELAQELRIWAFHTSTNSYIPFGSSRHDSSHVESLAEHEQKEAQRWAEQYAVNKQRHEARLRRMAERAKLHESERRVHASRNAERQKLLAQLSELSELERLERIVLASAFPIAAFPAEWASTSAAKELPALTRQALIRRLQRAPKGPWKKVLEALREK